MEQTKKFSTQEAIPFWRDERVLRILGQIIFLVAIVAFFYYIYKNFNNYLKKLHV